MLLKLYLARKENVFGFNGTVFPLYVPAVIVAFLKSMVLPIVKLRSGINSPDKFTPRLCVWGKLKFIVLLREPVSRDYSWYSQVIRDKLGRDRIKFEDLSTFMEYDRKHLKETITHVHRGGDYVNQLESFVQVFRRDQLLILPSTAVFQNSSKAMDAIAGFLEISKPAAWSGPFPHDDHLETFQDIISCISTYTPKLDCKFRDELAVYYAPLNERLYKWLEDTKSSRSAYEPDFIQFGDSWKYTQCVNDSRSELNKVIEASKTKRSCFD